MARQQHSHAGCYPRLVQAALPVRPQRVLEAAQMQGEGASGWGYLARLVRATAPPSRCRCKLWQQGWGAQGVAQHGRPGTAAQHSARFVDLVLVPCKALLQLREVPHCMLLRYLFWSAGGR